MLATFGGGGGEACGGSGGDICSGGLGTCTSFVVSLGGEGGKACEGCEESCEGGETCETLAASEDSGEVVAEGVIVEKARLGMSRMSGVPGKVVNSG